MNTQQKIYEIVDTIKATKSNKELVPIVSSFCKGKGIENFIYCVSLLKDLEAKAKVCTLDNFPTLWRKRYEQKDYFNEDFRVHHCKSKSTPIIWPMKDRELTSKNKKILLEAEEYGIKSGITFPFHGKNSEFGMFSVSTSEKFQHSPLKYPLNQYEVQLFGATLFDLIIERKRNKENWVLTPREKECLQWVALGKTSWEISRIIGISERTVVYHIQNATAKMNTTNRSSAVVMALMNGEI